MIRSLRVLVFASALGIAQPRDVAQVAKALEPFRGLMESGRFTEAEAILREVLPTPKSEPPKSDADLKISAYGLLWTSLAGAYKTNHDYPNAERVAKEMIASTEADYGTDALPIVAGLAMLSEIYQEQGKYAESIPLLERQFRLIPQDLRFLGRDSYSALGKALLVTGHAEDARKRMALWVDEMSKETPLLADDFWNTYAVVLDETGDEDGAAKVEAMVDSDKFVEARFYQADRDYLRARVLAARGKVDEADAIFRKWISVFEIKDPDNRDRDWDRVLMKPLEEYAGFLEQYGRGIAAVPVRERLREIQRRVKILYVQ